MCNLLSILLNSLSIIQSPLLLLGVLSFFPLLLYIFREIVGLGGAQSGVRGPKSWAEFGIILSLLGLVHFFFFSFSLSTREATFFFSFLSQRGQGACRPPFFSFFFFFFFVSCP